jgi:hypothetical protein
MSVFGQRVNRWKLTFSQMGDPEASAGVEGESGELGVFGDYV